MLWIESCPENALINLANVTDIFVQSYLLEEDIKVPDTHSNLGILCRTVDKELHVIQWFDTLEAAFSYFNRLKIKLMDTRNGVLRL